MGFKRHKGDESDDDYPVIPKGTATIGQQTSFIKNKHVRSEAYNKLRLKKKVGPDAQRSCAERAP
jgi:hypothetical protein